MRQHSCYESATEGDSFLVSAHTPADALRCALAVQKALLEAPWPHPLLAQPLCQPRCASLSLTRKAALILEAIAGASRQTGSVGTSA